ncbi:methylated-DNA--[protein]-cysteine S-methyltransferase [Sphingomonas suaedae]|uniref:Methylated-DNA--protein-cysteine methyltransferase n=1 Tax=Sphingomonas suaedae TaxID=2599297 RepID=A0A518RI50_9SPHN|nr:methylated-DNA--[protein]-cysteine S-methyltransferase [Sphingomonas suaedae]QDX27101.1 methylated-DNA--[protein]-cysteine S-methyltransferase [Sphingomonas suaedae]
MYARDHAQIATPIGPIRIEGDEIHVLRVAIGSDGPDNAGTTGPVRAAADQLLAYFTGDRKAFDLPLPPIDSARGRVLRDGLFAIPYGETMSYGALARELGSGARAIGQLCARNPLPIIVPCHRVLAAGGTLGAYSAGDGPATKEWLLEHERRYR